MKKYGEWIQRSANIPPDRNKKEVLTMKNRTVLFARSFVFIVMGLILTGHAKVLAQKIPENILNKIHYRELGPTRMSWARAVS